MTTSEMNQSRPSVAIVGASRDHRKFGNKAVRAFLQAGWTVFPINLEATQIEGLEVFRSVGDVPQPVDRVSIYLHPVDTLGVLPGIATRGADEVWLNPGSANRTVVESAEELGLQVVNGCSIVDIGLSPADFP